ncbi:MAG: sulfite exporter TauE/SafE family protein [Desulfocucumaceae bacterium]
MKRVSEMTYLPFADISFNTTTIFIIGLMVGIIEGVFGTLANLAVVPALGIFGLPLSVSASTNVGHTFGRASLFIYTGNKNRLALCRTGTLTGIFGLPGAYLGFKFHLYLINTGFGEIVIKLLYVVILLSASAVLFRQWIFFNRYHFYDDAPFPPFGLHWKFPLAIPGGSGSRITLARVVPVGFILGVATGLLGLGAGILGVPLFMYILGLSSKNAAATDSVAMLIIGSGTLFIYAAAGRVEFLAVLILLGAVSLGSHIGKLLPGELNLGHAKLAFSSMLSIAAVAVALSLAGINLSRMVMFTCGLIFCSSLIIYPLIQESIWPGKIARMIKGLR